MQVFNPYAPPVVVYLKKPPPPPPSFVPEPLKPRGACDCFTSQGSIQDHKCKYHRYQQRDVHPPAAKSSDDAHAMAPKDTVQPVVVDDLQRRQQALEEQLHGAEGAQRGGTVQQSDPNRSTSAEMEKQLQQLKMSASTKESAAAPVVSVPQHFAVGYTVVRLAVQIAQSLKNHLQKVATGGHGEALLTVTSSTLWALFASPCTADTSPCSRLMFLLLSSTVLIGLLLIFRS